MLTQGFGNKYALAEQLLPFLEFYVSRLDLIGEHLPYIRPHIPKLLKHGRYSVYLLYWYKSTNTDAAAGSAISTVTPYVDKLFAKVFLSLLALLALLAHQCTRSVYYIAPPPPARHSIALSAVKLAVVKLVVKLVS